jgi:IS4 transposase
MVLPAILDPFAKGAASAVMIRLALGWILQRTSIDPLLEEVAETQYDRKFLLSHFVEVMADVVCGFFSSPRAAFLKRQLNRIASISAFYRKLGRMEPAVPTAIVRQTAQRARQLIVASGGLLPEPIPGYSARVLDGNVLAGTDHRIDELRATRAATLPGKSLAIYEPISELVLDIILEENAHTQERALLDQVSIEPGQLWVMDRNFCVRTFLFRILRSGAFFLVRRHASCLPFEPIEPLRSVGRCEAGDIFEQPIWVDDPECEGRRYRLRRIVLRLDHPTREGEHEIVLITNLPDEIKASLCCQVYRGRWEIEKHFQKLTDLLHCEIPSLGRPRAALFAFSMSVMAGNALAVLTGSLRAVHGEEMVAELSTHCLVDDVARIYPGMMIAVPLAEWLFVESCSASELAELMNDLAVHVPIEEMLRSRRGPKKPRKTRESPGSKIHHVATKKLLEASKSKGLPPPGTAKPNRGKTSSYINSTPACSQG